MKDPQNFAISSLRTTSSGTGYDLPEAITTGDYLSLSASDAGLAFIKPCFSKLESSPTTIAEYLACGLPIIINAGIGDSDV